MPKLEEFGNILKLEKYNVQEETKMELNEKYKDCNSPEELKEKLCESLRLSDLEEDHPVRRELEDEISSFIKEIFG